MKTVFIILNYNTYDLTLKLAQKVSKYEIVDKIIVVDNCSTDNSYKELKKKQSDKIDVILSKKNGGYSYGNNYGAMYAKKYNPEILIFSNPDIDIEEKSLNLIINALKKNEYSILTGIEYDINNEITKPPFWNLMNYADDLLNCFGISRKYFKYKSEKENQVDYKNEIQEIQMFKGSFFVVSSKDFYEVNGFDENVFLFCEERILSRKFMDKNKKIGLVTKAKYNHNHSVSINSAYKYKYKQMKLLYNSRIYYNKAYNNINWLMLFLLKISSKISIFEFMLFDIFNVIKIILKKQSKEN